MKQRKPKLSKKGFFQDIPYIIIYLFAFVIVIFFAHKVYTEFVSGVQDSSLVEGDNNNANDILERGQATVNGFDYMFIFILAGIAMFLVASVFLIDSNSMLFILVILLILIMAVVSAVLGATVDELSSDASMLNTSSTYPMTTYIMGKFPLVILLYTIIGGIAFYAKSQMY